MKTLRAPLLALLLLAAFGQTGCKTLQQLAALKSVDFAIDRVADVRLAGVSFDRVRSYGDLNLIDAARLTAALARNELPLSLTVHVAATNPADNSVNARLVGMEWLLLLDDRETISGVINDPLDLPPGVEVGIPVTIQLNLIQFFDKNAASLFELAKSASGAGGQPTRIALKVRPTIETMLGPIRYPNAITVISREVGG
jgi:hypothetical protein